MFKGIFLGIFGLAITYVIYVMVHTGAFRPVEISIVDGPEFSLIYKKRIGAYHEISKDISVIEKEISKINISCRVSFGLFFDDPDIVDEDRLRSEVGCIAALPKGNVEEMQKKGILARTLPSKKYVKAKFAGSPAIGPFKVYPKIDDYLKENQLQKNGPVLETYTMHSGEEMVTEYFFAIAP